MLSGDRKGELSLETAAAHSIFFLYKACIGMSKLVLCMTVKNASRTRISREKVTDEVTGPTKRSNFHHFFSFASPSKAAISNGNKASEPTWIVSGVLLSASLSLWWPRIKWRSFEDTKSKTETAKFGFGWCDTCLITSLQKKCKNCTEKLFVRPKSGRNENRKNA